MNKPLDSSQRQVEEGQTIHRAFVCDVEKGIDTKQRTVPFVISTETPDRYGDIIVAAGWNLVQFRKNPIVLFSHNSRVPPIGKAIKIAKGPSDLTAIAKFMDEDTNPFAASIFKMIEEGWLKAVSVGFRPLKYERLFDEDERFIGFKFLKQELLEFSVVPIPANPECLIQARDMGMDTQPFEDWATNILNNWSTVGETVMQEYNVEQDKIEEIRQKASLDKVVDLPPEVKDSIEEEVIVEKDITVNRKGITFGNSAITAGKVNKTDSWSFSAADGNKLLGLEGDDWINYGRHHLGINSEGAPETKAHYRYPFAKGETVYRSGLISARQRAGQQGASAIFEAAGRMLKKIDGDSEQSGFALSDIFTNLPVVDEDKNCHPVTFDMVNDKLVISNVPEVTLVNSDLIPENATRSENGRLVCSGSENDPHIIIRGDNKELTYYIFGRKNDDVIVCRLVEEVIFTDDSLKDDVGEKVEHTKNKSNLADDIIEEVNTVVDGIIEEANIEAKDISREDTDSPDVIIGVLEKALDDFEELFDSGVLKKDFGTKKSKRKLFFLASYMKELAVTINPELARTINSESGQEHKRIVEESTEVTPVRARLNPNGKDNELTLKDVDAYITEKLGPKLAEIVQTHLVKHSGRLD